MHDDVLKYTKLKLDTLTNNSYISSQLPAIASPIPNRDDTQVLNIDSVFSSSPITNASENADNLLYQNWTPQPHSIPIAQPIYDNITDPSQRSKSAEPVSYTHLDVYKRQRQNHQSIQAKLEPCLSRLVEMFFLLPRHHHPE